MADQFDQIKKQIDDLNKRIAALGGSFFQDIDKAIASFGGGVKGAQDALKALRKEMDGLDTDANYFYETLKKVTAELKGQTSYNRDITSSYSKLSSLANKLKYDQDGISELSKKELEIIKKKISIQGTELNKALQLNTDALKASKLKKQSQEDERDRLLALSRQQGDFTNQQFEQYEKLIALIDKEKSLQEKIEQANVEIVGLLEDEENGLASLLGITEKRLEEEIKINKALGISGKLVDGIVSSLGKLGISSEFFENLKENMKDVAKSGDKWKVATTATKGLFKGIGEALRDPVTQLTIALKFINFFLKAAFEADKQAVNLGKSLGISAEAATKLREESVKYVNNSKDTFLTVKRLEQAQSDLSEELGIAVRFSQQELETQSRLTELTGLSAQEAAKLNKISSATGTTTEKYVGNLRKAIFFAQQETKTHFSSQKILQEISKLSAGILVKFQGNPKALGQAVIEAKKLGANLETIDKIGDSLLDWESSLQNELEAELLTGREINLERARAAALSGDQLALTREISDQVGTLADFQGMNVIAQTSLAKSFGLSREEMAEMLMQQEAINKYGDKAAKLNKEQLEDMKRQGLSAEEYLAKQEQQQTAQQKFNEAIVQLQEVIGNLVAGPLGSLLNSLFKALDYVSQIYKIFGKIGDTIKGFFGDKIGGVLGNAASALTIGTLIALLSKSMLKGTIFNPMMVKDVSSITGGGSFTDMLLGKKAGGQFKKGGGRVPKGGRTGGLLKGAGKIGGALALLSVGADLIGNLTDENRSVGNALGKTLDQNKYTAGGAAAGASIGALFAGVGAAPGALIGAGIGGIADFFSNMSDSEKVNDMISGYGARTLITPTGAVALNNQDTVIAGTNLFKGDDVMSFSKGTLTMGADMSAVVNTLKEIKNTISSLENRPIKLYIDGREITTSQQKLSYGPI